MKHKLVFGLLAVASVVTGAMVAGRSPPDVPQDRLSAHDLAVQMNEMLDERGHIEHALATKDHDS